MKLKKNQRKKELPKILSIIIILITLMYFGVYSNLSYIKSFFNEITVKISKPLISKISNEINLGINLELEKENKKLKKLLNLEYSNYEIISALVVKRNTNWYSELTIDKGKKDGISKNMAVTDEIGLIGKIKEVGDNYSIVSLITSNIDSMKVSVSVNANDNTYYGILSSYNEENGNVIIDNVAKDSNIKNDDKVYTNGLGGVYPSGIYIGEVVDIKYDKLGLNKIIEVKRESNYDDINYVNVIRR